MEDLQIKDATPHKESIDTAMTTSGGLVPKNLDQLWRLANIMAKSGLMPKGLQTPEAVCVAIQMGLEVGLSPMQAVQNIAIINNRPSIWGDAGLALVEASTLLEDFKETITQENGNIVATCWAKRKGRKTPVERTFTTEDAKQANLHKKEGPWQQYPKRMTQMRARWWVLRDLFPDVLKGLKAAEEVQDYVDMVPVVESPFQPAEPGKVAYEIKSAVPEIPELPKESAPKGEQNPQIDTKSQVETDIPDEATAAFLEEVKAVSEIMGQKEFQKTLNDYKMNGRDMKDFPVEFRSSFLKRAKSKIDKANAK
ncbi:MAG: recombinase RecT [Magnetococcus sp. WYHC-3]